MLAGLADLISPVPPDEFFGTIYGRTYRHFRGGRERFAGMLDWSDLNAILETRWADTDIVRLASKGNRVPRSEYTTGEGGAARLDGVALTNLLQGGASLIVEDVGALHRPIRDAVMAVEDDLHETLMTQLFVSGPMTTGFGAHWDPYDVFAIQLDGEKKWDIFRPTRPFPMIVDTDTPTADNLVHVGTVVLSAGDVLYLPRGWWHYDHPSPAASVHLTLGVPQRTGVDFVAWLAAELRGRADMRADIPRFAAPPDFERYVDMVREAVSSAVTADTLRRYFQHRDGHARTYPRLDLKWILSGRDELPADATVSRLVPRARVAQDEPGEVALVANGRILHFDARVQPLLTRIVDGTEQTVADLLDGSGLTSDEQLDVLSVLADAGVVAILGSARR